MCFFFPPFFVALSHIHLFLGGCLQLFIEAEGPAALFATLTSVLTTARAEKTAVARKTLVECIRTVKHLMNTKDGLEAAIQSPRAFQVGECVCGSLASGCKTSILHHTHTRAHAHAHSLSFATLAHPPQGLVSCLSTADVGLAVKTRVVRILAAVCSYSSAAHALVVAAFGHVCETTMERVRFERLVSSLGMGAGSVGDDGGGGDGGMVRLSTGVGVRLLVSGGPGGGGGCIEQPTYGGGMT